MTSYFNFIVLKLFIGGFFVCNTCAAQHRYQIFEGKAQGTTYLIEFESSKTNITKNTIDSIFKVIDVSMSLWNPNSTINKVNQNLPYDKLDRHFEKVFKASLRISTITNGYFDCTVRPLLKAWGFNISSLKKPTNEKIDSILQFVGYHKVTLKNSKVLKTSPNVQLDFNAIAQGYTVDVIADHFKKKKVKNYIIELGGEVAAKGVNSKGTVWQVGVAQPFSDKQLASTVTVNNKALATSGTYQNTVTKKGKVYSHIINPKTGQPIENTILSVSVIAKNCMLADAYATSCLVLGLEDSKKLAKQQKFEFMMIYEANGVDTVFKTKRF